MTLELAPALQEQLDKLAAESSSTPSALAQRAVEEYLAYRRQLAMEVNEAEEEADLEGWIPQEQVFERLLAGLRKPA